MSSLKLWATLAVIYVLFVCKKVVDTLDIPLVRVGIKRQNTFFSLSLWKSRGESFWQMMTCHPVWKYHFCLPEQKNLIIASVPSLVTSLLGYVTTSVSKVSVSKVRRLPSSLGNLTSLLLFETSRLFRFSSPGSVVGSSFRLLPEIFRVWRCFKFPIESASCLILLFCKYRACGQNSVSSGPW